MPYRQTTDAPWWQYSHVAHPRPKDNVFTQYIEWIHHNHDTGKHIAVFVKNQKMTNFREAEVAQFCVWPPISQHFCVGQCFPYSHPIHRVNSSQPYWKTRPLRQCSICKKSENDEFYREGEIANILCLTTYISTFLCRTNIILQRQKYTVWYIEWIHHNHTGKTRPQAHCSVCEKSENDEF
jgi:hypothetical protein